MNSPDTILNRQYVLMSISNLLSNSIFGVFFVFPLLILHIGGNKTDIGILMGAMPLAAVIFRPLASNMVDRIGRKVCYNAGCALLGIVSLLHIYFQRDIHSTFYILLLLRLLFGLGWALCLVGSFTLITDIVPKSRFAQGVGIFSITCILGIAFGPMLGEWLVRIANFTAMFIAAIALSILAVLLTIWIKDQFTYQKRENASSFMQILRYPPLLKGCLIAICVGFSLSAHSGFVTPYAGEKGIIISSYFFAYSIMAIFSRIIGGPVAAKFGERKIIPLALVITGIGFSSLMLVESTIGLIFSGMIIGLGHGTTTPNVMASAMRPVPLQNRGKANGVFSGGLDMGLFAGSFSLGWIGESFSFKILFLVAGSSLILGSLISVFWKVAASD